jgi:tetratricopeptide (TPR) repeat protein
MVGVREVQPGDLKKKSFVEWYDNMLRVRPNDTGLLYAKGAALVKAGEHEEALRCFERVTSLDPEHIKGWDAKAKTLSRLGKFALALPCFSKLVELDPQDETVWYGKGEMLSKLGRYREAIDCYNYAIELNPNYTDAWCGKGHALKEMKSPRKPPKPKKKKKPEKKEWSEVAGKVESLEDAMKCFMEALKKNPQHSKALEGKGIVLCEMGKVEEGLKNLDKAIEADPKSVEALYKKGKILNKMGKSKDATTTFSKIMETPFSYNVTYDPDCWVAKGLACFELSRYEDSLDFYDKALGINPDDPRAWNGKAEALTKLGEYTQAVKCYEKAIRVKPKSEQAWHGKATALRFSGETDESLKSYDKAIEINPEFVEAWYDKGTLLSVLKRFTEALDCFTEVLDLKPSHKAAKQKKVELEKRLGVDKAGRRGAKALKKPEEKKLDPMQKADVAMRTGRYEDALKLYDLILKKDGENMGAWEGKAKALSQLGRYMESIKCHEIVVKMKHKAELMDSKTGIDPGGRQDVGDRAETMTEKSGMNAPEPPGPAPPRRPEKVPKPFPRPFPRPQAKPNPVPSRTSQKTQETVRKSRTMIKKKRQVKSLETAPAKSKEDREELTIKSEDLDNMDKKIMVSFMDCAKTIPDISRSLGIPLAMSFYKVLRLEDLGILECLGNKANKEGPIGVINVYKCSEGASRLINGAEP